MSESRVDSCQWPTSGIGVALRRSDDWPFSTGPQAIGLISGFYTQVEVVPASLARELEAELRVATDETQTEAKPESLKEESSAAAEPAAARSVSEGEGLAARIEELELSLKQADEELARVTRAAVKGPDGYDYHWCPGVGWCPGCPPSAPLGKETGMPEMPLDAGIRPYVEALQTSSVETFESCEGGEDHAFLEPTIRFFGNTGEGFRALGVALGLGLPVAELRREWPVLDGEPTGPYWSMTFSHPARSVSGKEQEGER